NSLFITVQVRDYKAGIAALVGMLCLVDYPAHPLPAAGFILKAAEVALLLPTVRILLCSLLLKLLAHLLQDVVAGDPNDIADIEAVAPRQDQVAAKATVAAEDNAGVWEAAADPPYQQLQDGSSMLGGVLVALAQVSNQQLIAAEDIQRQETVFIVVAMKEATLLMTVHRIIRGVEIEYQLLWLLLKTLQKE